jgi:hypothetical protein
MTHCTQCDIHERRTHGSPLVRTSKTPSAGAAHSAPVLGAGSGPVQGAASLEHHAFEVELVAGDQEGVYVGGRVGRDDGERFGDQGGEVFEELAALGVRPVDEQLAVECEQVEGDEVGASPVAALGGDGAGEGCEVRRASGAPTISSPSRIMSTPMCERTSSSGSRSAMSWPPRVRATRRWLVTATWQRKPSALNSAVQPVSEPAGRPEAASIGAGISHTASACRRPTTIGDGGGHSSRSGLVSASDASVGGRPRLLRRCGAAR